VLYIMHDRQCEGHSICVWAVWVDGGQIAVCVCVREPLRRADWKNEL